MANGTAMSQTGLEIPGSSLGRVHAKWLTRALAPPPGSFRIAKHLWSSGYDVSLTR